MNTKNVILGIVLAAVLVITAIGSASADTVIDRCDFVADTDGEYYVLGQDLPCAHDERGITIGANNVTIDGYNATDDRYYKITGDKGPSNCWIGIFAHGGTGEYTPANHSAVVLTGWETADNVMIKNLEIENFCTGISAYFGYNNTVYNCTIHDNGKNNSATNSATTHGIHIVGVNNCTITRNEIYNNDGYNEGGCGDGGNGIFLQAHSAARGNYNNITYNDIYDNAKSGFFMKMQPHYNHISYNNMTGNGECGITPMCCLSNDNYIEHNYLAENGCGIWMGGQRNSIRYNRVVNNTGHGITMGRTDGSCDNEIYDNTVCGNGDQDIHVIDGVTGNHGDDNVCDTTYNYDDTGTTGCTLLCAGAVANFYAEPRKGVAPLTVNFTDNSKPEGDKESWAWDFNGDGVVDNTTQNPVCTYHTADYYSYYNVTLTVNWTGGETANVTKTEYIRVWQAGAAPDADFTCLKGVGHITLPVVFNDTSLGEVTNWLWDFGDGDTSEEQNPEHYYTEEGVYTVSLTVTGPGGTSNDTKYNCTRVVVGSGEDWPLIDAHFFASTRTGFAPFNVQFTDMSRSEGELESWNWSFGDGNTSEDRNPEHTYSTPGTYNVSLEVSGSGRTNETKTGYITVLPGEDVATTPFVLNGRTFNATGGELNNCTVTVENIDTSEKWAVRTSEGSNYYRLVITSGEVSDGDTLRIMAKTFQGDYLCNRTDYDVTETEINDGGMFNVNLTLGVWEIVWEYNTGIHSWPSEADRLANGNTLITDEYASKVYEVTPDGTTVWEYDTGLYSPYDADRLANGNTLITDSWNNRVIEVTPGGTIVWEYSTGLSSPAEADRLANGNTLITDLGTKRVIEVTADGTTVWEYLPGNSWNPWYTPRDADRLANGNTLITSHGWVTEVTADGTTVWEYCYHYRNQYGMYEDADRLANGNTLITNGCPYGRIIEVAPDGTIVWEYSDGLNYPYDADRLANGNTLITDGEDNTRIIEVGPAT